MKRPTNVLIADDHSVVRQGAAMILNKAFANINITQAEDFSRVLLLLEERTFDFIVLDIAIPEGTGVRMIEQIREIQPNTRILVFTAYDEDLYAMRYLKAGADGYLNKLSSEEELEKAFKAMMNNEGYASDSLRSRLAYTDKKKGADNPLEILSNRELEIARLLVNGDGNLEIGNKLKLQNSTVSTYKTRIFEKLSVNSVVGLISIFKTYDYTQI